VRPRNIGAAAVLPPTKKLGGVGIVGNSISFPHIAFDTLVDLGCFGVRDLDTATCRARVAGITWVARIGAGAGVAWIARVTRIAGVRRGTRIAWITRVRGCAWITWICRRTGVTRIRRCQPRNHTFGGSSPTACGAGVTWVTRIAWICRSARIARVTRIRGRTRVTGIARVARIAGHLPHAIRESVTADGIG
jgi:hypothetical protein